MDTWLPIVLVGLAIVAVIVVLAMRAARNRSEPRDLEDDATRREATDAYYRSQRDQTDFPPLGIPRRNERRDGDGRP